MPGAVIKNLSSSKNVIHIYFLLPQHVPSQTSLPENRNFINHSSEKTFGFQIRG